MFKHNGKEVVVQIEGFTDGCYNYYYMKKENEYMAVCPFTGLKINSGINIEDAKEKADSCFEFWQKQLNSELGKEALIRFQRLIYEGVEYEYIDDKVVPMNKEQTDTLSGLERLSGDYIRGYTHAIQDITNIFEYVEDDLKYHNKRMNGRFAKELLKVILDNRANIREYRLDKYKFIRYNKQQDKLEWFENKQKIKG